MSVCPPPWTGMTAEEISQRLALLTSQTILQHDLNRSFTQHAVFSTGSEELDRLLPDGGMTCGTVLEVFGPPSGGKSRLVRRMISSFAAQGALEWTTRGVDVGICDGSPSKGLEVQQECLRARAEECCRPREWCVFYVLSDPSSLNPRHLREELEKALQRAMLCDVHCEGEIERLLDDIIGRVQVVNFATLNDLLNFFRFLYHEEYPSSMHHANQRRALVVIDSVARLWDHPTCGATKHARHWAAAELVRELRNVIMLGNGWRGEYCGNIDSHHLDTEAGNVFCSVQAANMGTSVGGSVAVVLVNGCTNTRYCHTVVGPLGVPLWLAAAADIRLFIEPTSTSGDYPPTTGEDDDGMLCTHQYGAAKHVLAVRVAKGSGSSAPRVGNIFLP
ncbi:recA bacterial DNA recombination protein [Trypanosoma brucei equiperdum]|uniref:RecA bacterial DNA recombination protein n=2 Tax=Trypanosoma brucei TaxID=5691 RepID=A0A3L6KX37_9TRYP|nr:recA bacterial DNA recombination protein [Trypanosoma brucei equiperdum]